jgi:hypothetical protein
MAEVAVGGEQVDRDAVGRERLHREEQLDAAHSAAGDHQLQTLCSCHAAKVPRRRSRDIGALPHPDP